MANEHWHQIPIVQAGNPWARISEIAARVGVPPDDGKAATVTAQGADGQWYDLMAVVIGVLDHIDKAVSK